MIRLKRYISRCGLILAALMSASVLCIVQVSASTTTGAFYKADLVVKNASYATADNAVPFTLDTDALVDGKFADSDLANTAITDGAGTDIPYMPAVSGGDDWVIFVDDVAQNANQLYYLYTGGADDMEGKIRYFPGAAGMAVSDAANLELGNNFELEIAGYFDTSTSANLAYKEAAISSSMSSGTLTTSIYAAPAVNVQNTQGSTSLKVAYGANWGAQSFMPTISGKLTAFSLKAARSGSGTQTFYVWLYAASGNTPTGSALATLYAGDASIIAAGAGDVAFTVSTPPTVTSGTQYALVWARPDAGSGDQITAYYDTNGFAIGNGDYCASTDSGATWSTVNDDFRISVTISAVALSSVASGLTSGEHTIKITADGTNFKTYWDGVEKDSDALGAVSVPNNAYNWSFVSGTTALYVEYVKVTVSGTLRGHWYWQNAATFTDQSGNSNTATPSFRTTSTDADLTAYLQSFAPLSLSELSSYSTGTDPTLIPTVPADPSVTVDMANWSKVPGGEVILTILDVGDIPPALFFFPFMGLVVVLVSFLTYNFTRDMFFTGMMGNLVIGAFISLSTWYILVLIVGVVAWIVLLVKRKTVSV